MNRINDTLTLLSPAKLNLFLHILGQRADGYHELQSAFQLLEYGDFMQFEVLPTSSAPHVRLETPIANVPEKQNLIIQAADALQPHLELKQRQGYSAPNISISIDKVLPMGGGLGGGSSNAATTLLALNHLWDLQLSIDALADIGLSLGADVPVFVKGQSAWAEGIGEQLSPLPNLPENWFLVIVPSCQVETKKIFNNKGLTRNTPRCKIGTALRGKSRKPNFYSTFNNDCEGVARSLYKEIDEALVLLDKFGQARMTGTGSCVFCEFSTQIEAETALNDLPTDIRVFLAKGVNISPVHKALSVSPK